VSRPDADAVWAARFPELYAVGSVDYAEVDLTFTIEPASDDDTSRAHVVAVTAGGEVVVCRSVEEWRFLPGGTREPGESVAALVRRELAEEAGCEPLGEPVFLGRHVARSRNRAPYRPHLPHPVASWAYYVVPVMVVGPPTNPDDGEHVVAVRTLPPAEAADWLRPHDPIHADVVLLAVALGLVAG
jgi:8-oxo-dGTP diphosphatase